MGIWDMFRTKSAEPTPQVNTEPTQTQPTTASVIVHDSITEAFIRGWLSRNTSYIKYVADKERGNATVAAITQRLSGAVAEMFDRGVEIIDKDGEVSTSKEAERIFEQLRDPNDMESVGDFIRNIAMSLLLQGEAFIHAPYVEGAGIEEMAILQADQVQINIDTQDKRKIKNFTYEGGKTYAPDLIIHIKLPNPDQTDLRGLSPLAPIVKELELHTTIKAQEQKLIQQGGVKNLISVSVMPDENMAAVVDELKNALNSQDAKKSEIKAVPLQVHKLGDNAADLSLLELSNKIGLAVCSVYNFPPNLLTADSTFSNLAEAKKYVYTLSKTYLDAILNGFRRQFRMKSQGLQFRFNPDKIEEMRPNRKELLDALDEALTTDEKRALFNYPETPGGAFVLTAMNKMPLERVATPVTITDKV